MAAELLISVSNTMDKSTNVNEHGLVRVPKQIRENHALDLYSFLTFKTTKHTTISLQVAPAYIEDTTINAEVIYVTTDTYNKIEIKKSILTPIDKITLGCDPELFIINSNTKEIVDASTFFNKAGEVGSDGQLLEIRPLPSIYSKSVLKYIRYLLVKTFRITKLKIPYETELIGASYYKERAAGFHIHFGIPPQLINPNTFEIKMAVNQIVKLLDYYVGIPSIIPEVGEDTGRRSNVVIEYGKPGNYRLEFPTLEYRVPGGLLLSHPVLTEGLLSISLVVIKDILSRLKIYTNDFSDLTPLTDLKNIQDLYKNLPKQKEDIIRIICSQSSAGALKIIDSIFKDIESMLTFSEEKYSIINFYNFIMDNKNLTTRNIKDNWGFTDYEHE